ncbi:hypothetical protein FOA52_010061 [Chlamydomonas sp. UWO 241]|nr:hypothetical protein FOA52_010061 [Chlamydomonas sp. UWO 241]
MHGVITPGSNLCVGTYECHVWKVVGPGGTALGEYSGDCATITICSDGLRATRNAGRGAPASARSSPELSLNPRAAAAWAPGAAQSGAAPSPSPCVATNRPPMPSRQPRPSPPPRELCPRGDGSLPGGSVTPALPAPGSLQHSPPHALLRHARAADAAAKHAHRGGRSGGVDGASPSWHASWHLFVNDTDAPVELYWHVPSEECGGGKAHAMQKHGVIEPGSNLYVGTYECHAWKVFGPGHEPLGEYSGDCATITICSDGLRATRNAGRGTPASSSECGGHASEAAAEEVHPVHGTYRIRGAVLGLGIWAFDCVGDDAVSRAAHITDCMLAHAPPWLVKQLVHSGCVLAIVGREQHVTDLPPHRFMKHLQGRDLNTTSRGLGGTLSVPCTSVGEENVTMEADHVYPYQSVFVHELGHAVLNIGLNIEWHKAVCDAFDAARVGRLYRPECYMMTNEQEYWAVGTEAWFESTIRSDVNDGVTTRERLRAHDPGLSKLLAAAYGDGPWRYVHTCPRPLRLLTWQDGPAEEALRFVRTKRSRTEDMDEGRGHAVGARAASKWRRHTWDSGSGPSPASPPATPHVQPHQ